MTVYDTKVGDLIQLRREISPFGPTRVGGAAGIVIDKQSVPAKHIVGRSGYVDIVYVMYEGGKILMVPITEMHIFKVLSKTWEG